jgi:gamma-glutamyltranspeptidase / glutathione hydrolase
MKNVTSGGAAAGSTAARSRAGRRAPDPSSSRAPRAPSFLALLLALPMALIPTPAAAQEDPFALTGPGDRYFPPYFAARSAALAPQVMAATSHPLATQVALDVLRRGGNAVDAAIAANAVIGFLEPTGNGIGGDLFAIVWSARDERVYGLNASGRAPAGVTLERVLADVGEAAEIPGTSPHSITVPGAVDGWFEMHERFGAMPMPELLAPAIRYAREGAPVPQYIAALWARAPRLREQPGFARVFLPDGRPPARGERFRNPELARTLERIAAGGRDAFYRGDLAREIDEWCRRTGCHLRLEDLAAHRSEWVEPVGVDFHGYRLWQLPPNSQGLAALQMLRLLEAYDLRAMGHNSAEYLHHLVEAKKIAYEDRGRLYADPAFASAPIAELLSDEYTERRRRLLDPARASAEIPAGDPRAGRGGTIYLAVGDSAGNMVSLIQSNYAGFGSGWVPDGMGFSFQNRGAQFSLESWHPNAYAPGKRPFHTIIPGFVTRDGRPYMAFGVMGGDVQPQGQVQVFLNHVLFGMDIQEAGDAARFRHADSTEPAGRHRPMADGGCLSLESGVGPEVRDRLRELGHRICQEGWIHYGGYQAVMWDAANRVYWGATEARVDGIAAGW